jgi:hypothetical protein
MTFGKACRIGRSRRQRDKIRVVRIAFFGFIVVGSALCAATAWAQAADQALKVPLEIRAEALREPDDPLGLPLPLASHWNTGIKPPEDTFDPAYQIGLIEAGHYLLPFFQIPDPSDPVNKTLSLEYYERPLKKLAEWGLPFSMVSSEWESPLTAGKKYLGLPAQSNPNVIGLDGKIRLEVDPMGPVEPWRELGKKWTTSPGMQQLLAIYPLPPLVVLVSNNEHAKLSWPRADESKRFLDRYGIGKTESFKRQVFSEGWIERYRALLAGMREGLANTGWNGATKFIGYDAFGPRHFARWSEWQQYALYVPGRVVWSALAWEGGTASYYVNNWNSSTDYTVFGPQIESMNWVFMQAEAARLNKRFWFEISTWDGNVDLPNDKRAFYAGNGQIYNPVRYAATVRFGMWLLRPRVVREFRGWTERRSKQGAYFLAVVQAVDEVHNNPVLRRFWRKGNLVPNRKHTHPYQVDVPDEYKNEDRWFLLDTDLDPVRPWKLDTALPVFALALTTGTAGTREWLVYAHAPLGLRQNVKVVIPNYGPVTIDVPPAGAFYLIEEQGGKVSSVARKVG